MGEYTPTTESVRDAYAMSGETTHVVPVKRLEFFDRWLAAHDAQVRAQALRDLAAELETEAAAEIMDPRDRQSMSFWAATYRARAEQEAGE